MLSTSKIKGGLKEYGYISFDMGGRNGQAERYLHSRIEASAVDHDDWTRVRAVHLNHHLMMLVIWCLMSLST